MELAAGVTVGDYEVLALLGRGGMGEVFKVRNVITDRVEAMKVLLQDAGQAAELADRFGHEIKVLASLEHPNIASLRTALRVDDHLVMIMEMVEGSSLDHVIRAGPLGVAQGVHYVAQVLDALSYAHAHGVIHRDIKPSNILVTAAQTAKLTDFGIASRAGDPRLTATGMTLGSLYYMSPEQVESLPLDQRSDLYSVGVTLYEALTGKLPIDGSNFYEVMKGHLTVRPRPAAEIAPSIPLALSRAIGKSLEKSPQARFQNAREFRDALASSVEGVPTTGGARTQMGISFGAPPAPGAKQSGSTESTPPVAHPTPGTGYPPPWDPAQLDAIRKELAVFIGPMAKVLVRREARRTKSRAELCDALAAEISAPGDRKKFLAAVSRRSSSSLF